MNRSPMCSQLLLIAALATLPGAARAASTGQVAAVTEGRLEVARMLLAEAGITAPLAADPAAVRALAAAFRDWEAASSGTHAPGAVSCVVDDVRAPAGAPAPLRVQDLLPAGGSRLGRALSFSLGFQDLQDTFLVEAKNEDTPDDPNDTILKTVVNPESYTPTATFSFRPGDLLLSSADIAQALAVVTKYPTLFDTTAAFEPESRTFDSFARSLGGGRRFLGALTLAASFARRPRLPDANNAIPPELLRQDRTSTTWSVKFDPFLFLNPLAAQADGYQAALGYAKLYGGAGVGRGPDPCDPFQMAVAADRQISRLCLAALSATPPRGGLWLPAVEFKSVDQFDYVKTGTQFLPNTEKDLESLTLTWDLARIFSVAKARDTALGIFKNHLDLQNGPPRIKTASGGAQEPLAARKGSFLHRRLEAEGLAAVSWRVETPQGKKSVCAFPGVQLTKDGLLIGTPEVEGDYAVTVVASDGLQQESRVELIVTVDKGPEADLKAVLMAMYLELAVRPEVIADEGWFEALLRSWKQLGGEEVAPRAARDVVSTIR